MYGMHDELLVLLLLRSCSSGSKFHSPPSKFASKAIPLVCRTQTLHMGLVASRV